VGTIKQHFSLKSILRQNQRRRNIYKQQI